MTKCDFVMYTFFISSIMDVYLLDVCYYTILPLCSPVFVQVSGYQSDKIYHTNAYLSNVFLSLLLWSLHCLNFPSNVLKDTIVIAEF